MGKGIKDENGVKVSIVIPCLNEEKTIAETIDNAKEALRSANINGEVIVVDSSNDNSPKVAASLGVKVLSVPGRGLGHAYIDAIPHVRGKYVVMGDADCTYDFKEINKFINKLDEGYEFVIGTRIKGTIQTGAMPPLHRYFGTPLITWILNSLIGTKFSDTSCGLRALTYDALKKIDIQSHSWEYASEMIIKAGLLKLKSCEVPINFYKDKEGRQSHHKRIGWFSPWLAGWINLKVMLLYVPNQMIVKPGLFFLFLGLLLIFMQVNGPVKIGPITFMTNFMLLGLALSVLGFSAIQMGILVQLFSDINRFFESKSIKFIVKYLSYTKMMIIGFVSLVLGLTLSIGLFARWYMQGYQLQFVTWQVVLALLMIIFGMQTVLFNLVYQSFMLGYRPRKDHGSSK